MEAVVVQLVKLDSSNQQLVLAPVLHVEQEKRQHQQHRILKEIVVCTVASLTIVAKYSLPFRK